MATDIGHWKCDFEFDPNEWFGFIYRVINVVDNREYIGKKQFNTRTRKKVKGRKNRKIVIKESNWKNYTTSSKYINEDIEKYGKDIFTFHIIEVCPTKAHLTYREVELQWDEKVLSERMDNGEKKYYNKAIGAIKFTPPDEFSEETRKRMSKSGTGRIVTRNPKTNVSCTKK
jgi:Kyanoviridae NAD synthetase